MRQGMWRFRKRRSKLPLYDAFGIDLGLFSGGYIYAGLRTMQRIQRAFDVD
jgi:hypothetical protein